RHERAERADERARDCEGAEPARRAALPALPAERDHDRSPQRERENHPAPVRGRHQPWSSFISSTSIGMRLRYIATITPRPTTTSQAATTITISAKIWPSGLPHIREKPISA